MIDKEAASGYVTLHDIGEAEQTEPTTQLRLARAEGASVVPDRLQQLFYIRRYRGGIPLEPRKEWRNVPVVLVPMHELDDKPHG